MVLVLFSPTRQDPRFSRNEEMHRCGGKPLLARHLCIERRLLRLRPPKNGHQLRLSRPTLRGNTRTCLPQPVRRTMPQAGLIAPFPEAVSEAIRRSFLWFGLIGDEEGHVAGRRSGEDRIQLRQDGEFHYFWS